MDPGCRIPSLSHADGDCQEEFEVMRIVLVDQGDEKARIEENDALGHA